MSNEPKPPLGRKRLFWIWLVLFAVLAIATILLETAITRPQPLHVWIDLAVGLGVATLAIGLLLLVRWLSCWRNLRRGLLGLAIVATLIAIFYTVENWRGKRAWEQCKRDLEAQGAVLDWNTLLPPPVPDEQNIFKAPRMNEWFVGRGSTELSKRLGTDAPWIQRSNSVRLVLAELTVVAPGRTEAPESVWQLNDPGIQSRAARWLDEALGPSLQGPQNFLLLARIPAPATPAQITMQSAQSPAAKDLQAVFSTRKPSPIRVEPAGLTNSFRVVLVLDPACSAADYLAWSDRFEPDFRLIRDALKRPYGRMDGDYQQPFAIPIPNFVTVRIVAQTLAARAQSHLLLGHPEKAVEDVALIRALSGVLEGKPTGKPMTLVAAMINVAVTGLYVDTIADGFRLHAWREQEIAALEQQLRGINVIPEVMRAFEHEPVAVCRTLETVPLRKILNMLDGKRETLSDRIYDLGMHRYDLMPRGWIYQNMAFIATHERLTIKAFDPARNVVLPQKAREFAEAMTRFESHRTPYNFIAGFTLPNISRATQTMVRNQTLVNEARIVCALERFRSARGQYPENLDALAPEFIDKPAPDLIGGQSLKYRRVEDGTFILYSIGWNETDDGGRAMAGAVEKGDWTWPPVK
jgi:hypothetical protein